MAEIDLRQRVSEIPFWWHSIELADGVRSPGVKTPDFLSAEWDSLDLPPIEGRSVLDIGAWDGWFSFAAEDHGASRVVALDHFAWSCDFATYQPIAATKAAAGQVVPDPSEVPEAWSTVDLPGKRGFDLAHRARGSRVEDVVGNFMDDDLSGLGTFDVVLFLGVLYHMVDPVASLRRVAALTSGTAVIETHALRVGGMQGRAMAEFFPGAEFAGDPTNWWIPSIEALEGMCLAAGFSATEVVVGPPQTPEPPAGTTDRYVAVVHAHR